MRQRKRADRVGESQHVVEHLQLDVFSNPSKKSKSAVAQKKRLTTSSWWYITRKGFSCISNTALFLLFRTYSYDACVQRLDCFPGTWSSWHLQVVSLHLLNYGPLSASFALFCFFFYEYYFPARIAGGGAKRLVYLTKKKLVRTQTDDNGNTMLQKFSFQIIFKKIGWRYSRTTAMGKTEKKFFFRGLFVHAVARGGTCATLKNVNTLIKKSSRDDRPSIST